MVIPLHIILRIVQNYRLSKYIKNSQHSVWNSVKGEWEHPDHPTRNLTATATPSPLLSSAHHVDTFSAYAPEVDAVRYRGGKGLSSSGSEAWNEVAQFHDSATATTHPRHADYRFSNTPSPSGGRDSERKREREREVERERERERARHESFLREEYDRRRAEFERDRGVHYQASQSTSHQYMNSSYAPHTERAPSQHMSEDEVLAQRVNALGRERERVNALGRERETAKERERERERPKERERERERGQILRSPLPPARLSAPSSYSVGGNLSGAVSTALVAPRREECELNDR